MSLQIKISTIFLIYESVHLTFGIISAEMTIFNGRKVLPLTENEIFISLNFKIVLCESKFVAHMRRRRIREKHSLCMYELRNIDHY